jgi:TetR/AcrR family transcriptional regulator, cholesterol catabolism regulator
MYISKALSVFRQEGLRMSLEELAEKMGITKKTLYNHFNSKEELLSECIHDVFADMRLKMMVLIDENSNAIECMYAGFREIKAFFMHQSPLFIKDLNKLYPEMVSVEHTSGYGMFREKIMLNFEKGIKEGLYIENMDTLLISQYFMYSIFGFYIQSVTTSNEFSAAGYFETILSYNLRALVTEKGRIELTKYIKS